MFSRPDISILLVSDTIVLRADFVGTRKPRLANTWQRDVDVEASLPIAVDIALGFEPRIGRTVLVLATSVWTQLVSVPKMSITGMALDELRQALKFEVETLSGIEVDDAALAVAKTRQIDDQQQFLVSELSDSELRAVVEQISERGGRVIRVGHPVGCPNFHGGLVPRQEDGCNDRLEFWPNLVCRISRGGEAPQAVSQSDTRGTRWVNDLGWSDLSEIEKDAVVVAAPGVPVPDSLTTKRVLSLSDDATMESWLAGWAKVAMSRDPQTPLLEVPKPSRNRHWRTAAATLAAAAVAALCYWHWDHTNLEIDRISRESKQLEQPGREQKRLNAELNSLLAEKNKLEIESASLRDNVEDVEFLLSVQNHRFDQLLRMLLKLRTDDMVINKIEPNQFGLAVSGVSLYGQSAPLLASQLRNAAVPLGWQVNPPTQEGDNQMTSGGPWKFEMVLRDIGPNAAQRTSGRIAEAEQERRTTSLYFGSDKRRKKVNNESKTESF